MRRSLLLCSVCLAISIALVGCSSVPEVESAAEAKTAVASSPVADAKPMDAVGATQRFRAQSERVTSPSPANGLQVESLKVTPSRPATPNILQERQVVRKADLTVRVKNVEKSEKEVGRIVTAVGGYVESANSTDLAGDKPKIAIQLRIPATTFDDTLSKLEALGTRMSKSVSSEDVTTQLVDLDARLKTLRMQEDALRDMVKNTQNVNALFDLQQRLTDVRTQIESIAGQRKALGGLASLSTVTVNLEQNSDPSAPPTDPSWLSQSWGEAVGSLASTGRVLMVIAVWVLTFTPIWIPAAWFARRAYLATKKTA